MWDLPEGSTPTAAADEGWLGSWGNELEYFLPALLFPLAVLPTPADGPLVLQVDSGHTNEEEPDPENASPSSVPTMVMPAVDSPKRKRETEQLAQQEEELVQAQAAAYQRWERDQMANELARVDGKRRALDSCRVTVEAASSSTDQPRVCHSYSFMVPSNGDAIHISISAQMVQDPDWAPNPTTDTQQAQCGSMIGSNVLDLLEFGDYERVYQAWKDGKVTTQQVEQQWGREVAELIVTHDLVAAQSGPDTLEGVALQGVQGPIAIEHELEAEGRDEAVESGGTTLSLEDQRETQLDRRESWEIKDDRGEK